MSTFFKESVRVKRGQNRSGRHRQVAFLGTCSYGGGTWVTVAIWGVGPSFMVVRCSSMVVVLRYRRRQLATGGVPPWRAVKRGLRSQCYCMTPQRQTRLTW